MRHRWDLVFLIRGSIQDLILRYAGWVDGGGKEKDELFGQPMVSPQKLEVI